MKTSRRKKLRQGIVVTVIVIAILCAIEFLFDPLTPIKVSFENRGIQKTFVEAQKKWNALQITDYSMMIERSIPLWGNEYIKVTIRDNKLSEILTTRDPNVALVPIRPEDFSHYNDLTIPNLYDRIEDELEQGNGLKVSFDDLDGHVTSLSYNCIHSYGFLLTWITDCGGSWIIKSLTLNSVNP